MMTLLKSISVMFIMLLALGGIFVGVAPIIAGRTLIQDKTDSYEYSVQGAGENGLYVTIGVSDEGWENYIQTNQERGKRLVEQGSGELVPVQITLAKPIEVEKAKELAKTSQLVVDNFALVGYSTQQHIRSTSIQFNAFEEIPKREVMDFETGEEVVYQGVMVIQGHVPASADGLGQWLSYNEVYLVDTAEFEVRQLLNQNHAQEIEGKELSISVPTPFWTLDW